MQAGQDAKHSTIFYRTKQHTADRNSNGFTEISVLVVVTCCIFAAQVGGPPLSHPQQFGLRTAEAEVCPSCPLVSCSCLCGFGNPHVPE